MSTNMSKRKANDHSSGSIPKHVRNGTVNETYSSRNSWQMSHRPEKLLSGSRMPYGSAVSSNSELVLPYSW